jgi:Putative prokaryotic signal transducing protein
MKNLYEASNAIEAHMIRDLLKQEGLTAYIRGEYLQGAVGEIPASGLVRLEINESEYEQAREFVKRWDAAQPAVIPLTKTTSRENRRSNTLIGFSLGLAIGVAACYAFFKAPISTNGFDHNGNGVLDEKWTVSPSGITLKYEIDRNLDGKIDLVTFYNSQNKPISTESDDDFNGTFETKIRYVGANVEIIESDTDGDGSPDLRTFYVNGVMSTSTYMNPATGLPLRIEYFKLGKITKVEIDSNRDGVLDTLETFNMLGELVSTQKMPK